MSSVKSDSGEDALLSILAARIWTDGSRESHAAQAYPQARQGILITGYKVRHDLDPREDGILEAAMVLLVVPAAGNYVQGFE